MLCIRSTIIALAVGLMIGFGSGYYTKHKFAQAEVVVAMKKERKETARVIADMQAKEATLQSQVERSGENAESIRTAIQKRGVRLDRRHSDDTKRDAAQVCDAVSGDEYLIDPATVWMLNLARENRPASPAPWIDDQGKAAAATAGAARTGFGHDTD